MNTNRTRLLWLALPFLMLLTPATWAQEMAKGMLFTRSEGDLVRAAIEIEVESGWHLFHTELGGPEAIGKPLKIEWDQKVVEAWSDPQLPEPERYLDLEEGPRAWAWVHRRTILVHAALKLVDGAQPEDVSVTLKGQTCMDEGGLCLQLAAELDSEGGGEDELFEEFPEGLVATAAEVGASPSEEDWDPDFADAHAAARAFVRSEAGRARLVVQVAIEEGFHLYHGPTQEDMGGEDVVGMPTTFEVEGGGVEWSAVVYPEPHEYIQEAFTEGEPDIPYYAHSGSVAFRAEGQLEGANLSGDVRVAVKGLTCDDTGCQQYSQELVALPGGSDTLFAAFDGGAGAGTQEQSSGSSAGGTESGQAAASTSQKLESMSLGGFLLLAVLWGIITLLMPCTYPMIPITISFFTKQAIERKGKVLPLALMYGVGIVAIFVLIGVLLGAPIIRFATHPITNIVIGSLFFVFALALFGVINLQPPAFMQQAAGRASQTGGYLGVFLMGATLVVTSFTCTAPFVGSLLSIGAGGGADTGRIALGMGVFGLTMATPFVALSLVPGKLQQMPKAGEWMHVIKVYLGFIELAAALKFFSNADISWQWGLLSREVFLILWTGILFAATAFLFGWIRLEGEQDSEVSPLRMTVGVMTLLGGFYFGLGSQGYVLDDITTAIVPNYSSPRLGGAAGGNGGESSEHTIIKDDLPAAIARARSEDKLLLVNFTGFT